MAWQTPKTDWAAADGVRDADFNRIEGNILELYNTSMQRASVTLYVSPSGDDTTGTGASASPYRTINKALSTIPKNLNGLSVTISIASGTYNETVLIEGFSGPIRLTGIYGDGYTATVNGITVRGCMCYVQTLQIVVPSTSAFGVVLDEGAILHTSSSITLAGGTAYFSINRNSAFISSSTVVCNSINSTAINVDASTFYATTIAGTGSINGIRSYNGGITAYGSSTLTVTGTLHFTTNGGRIYSGAQNSVPNY